LEGLRDRVDRDPFAQTAAAAVAIITTADAKNASDDTNAASSSVNALQSGVSGIVDYMYLCLFMFFLFLQVFFTASHYTH
jgi:choline-glycine betaine transporter